MTSLPADVPSLPSSRAFVVQLRQEAEVERGNWAGRIAHVVSGRAAHFESLQELVAFVEAELAREGVERSGAPVDNA